MKVGRSRGTLGLSEKMHFESDLARMHLGVGSDSVAGGIGNFKAKKSHGFSCPFASFPLLIEELEHCRIKRNT